MSNANKLKRYYIFGDNENFKELSNPIRYYVCHTYTDGKILRPEIYMDGAVVANKDIRGIFHGLKGAKHFLLFFETRKEAEKAANTLTNKGVIEDAQYFLDKDNGAIVHIAKWRVGVATYEYPKPNRYSPRLRTGTFAGFPSATLEGEQSFHTWQDYLNHNI